MTGTTDTKRLPYQGLSRRVVFFSTGTSPPLHRRTGWMDAPFKARATLYVPHTQNSLAARTSSIHIHSLTPQRSAPTMYQPHGRYSSRPPGSYRSGEQQHPPPTQPSSPARHPHQGPAPIGPRRRHHPATHTAHSTDKQPSRQQQHSHSGHHASPAPRHPSRVARPPSANPTATPLAPPFS